MIFLRRFISSSLQCARVCVCCVCLRNCERDIQIDSSRKWSLLLLLSLPNILRSPILFFFRSITLLCIYSNVILLGTQKTNKHTHTDTKDLKSGGFLSKKKNHFVFVFLCFRFVFIQFS